MTCSAPERLNDESTDMVDNPPDESTDVADDTADEQRIARALRLSLAFIAVLVVLVLAGYYWLAPDDDTSVALNERDVSGPQQAIAEAVSPPPLQFTDIATQSGIDFVHESGAYGERLLPETMGGGVAFFDYDNDGDQDLFLVNSTHWPWQPKTGSPPTSRLYRNDGSGAFEDVSQATGLDLKLYGMGTAVGDFDGDGWVDVFVTAYGQNRLLRNVDGQKFVDVTSNTGVAGSDAAWSTSAAFFDFDKDGDLDLFVCNYVEWTPEINREVDYRLAGIGRAYGPPTDFAGTDSYLYRNDGDAFTDVSLEAGITVAQQSSGKPAGKALAVLPVDVDGDGWLDLAVANDTVRNFLFVNQQDGSFREAAVEYGFAYDNAGLATGAMGIDSAYVDNGRDLAIAIGNFANEMSSFYVRRDGEQTFSDDAIVAGIGADSRRALTFGLMFLDVDLDGWIDLLSANGHVEPDINRVQSSQSYAQPLQLYWNCGSRCTRTFELVEGATGDFDKPLIGRGAAYADIDADGDLDMVITAVGERVVLLRNDQALRHHWIRLQLRGDSPNVNAIGATVAVRSAGMTQTRSAVPSRSYLSQVEMPLTFGLGDAHEVDEIVVTWPDGSVESWSGLAVDSVHTLDKGSGSPL